jgi:GH15 family glucan-1,4-alpha-glucosidase
MDAGYYDEAVAWREWLLRAIAGSPGQMQIMYGLAGERRLTEWELPWLPGYEGSKPVRVGNGAHCQMQLDVYGEVMDALHQARLGGIEQSETAWALQRQLLDHLEQIWEQPDCGIWEVRGPSQHFTHSKIMAWVVLIAAQGRAEAYGFNVRSRIGASCARRFMQIPRARLRQTAQQVSGVRPEVPDASRRQMPEPGFLPLDDPRLPGTIKATKRAAAR